MPMDPNRLAAGAKAHLANALSVLRMVLSCGLLAVRPFSAAFWVLYGLCGASDLLDGRIARRLKQQSRIGERLDSLADLLFAAVCAAVLLRHVPLPKWLLLCGALIALIKLGAVLAELITLRRLTSRHTAANRAAGVMLFFSPLSAALFGEMPAMLLCVSAAALAALYDWHGFACAWRAHARQRRTRACP